MFKGDLVNIRLQKLSDMPILEGFLNSDLYFETVIHDHPRFSYKDQLEKKFKERLEKHQENELHLTIETLDGKVIGVIGLDFIFWKNGFAYMYDFIGDTDYLEGGYREEAIRLFVNFAFNENNVRKLKTQVLAVDEKSLKAYRTNSFQQEVLHQQEVFKHGQYLDVIELALLKEEYKA